MHPKMILRKNINKNGNTLFCFSFSKMIAFKIDTRATWKAIDVDKSDQFSKNQRNKLLSLHCVSKNVQRIGIKKHVLNLFSKHFRSGRYTSGHRGYFLHRIVSLTAPQLTSTSFSYWLMGLTGTKRGLNLIHNVKKRQKGGF